MPRVPVHDLDTAPEAAHNTLAALQHRFGRIINIHGEMAHSPVVLAAYTGIQAAIVEHGSFDGRTREAVALAIAAVDNCGYCQAVHTLAGQRAGLDLDQTVAIRAVQPVEPKLDALLAVARESVGRMGEVDDSTWQRALDAGWSVEELTELFTHVIVNMFTNYFNHYVGTDLDFPPAPELTSSRAEPGA